MNKKAILGHGMSWLWKFLILIIVVGGVVAVVASHYSVQYDVRSIEAEILSEKIINCISSESIIHSYNENIIKSCFPFDENELYLNLSINNDNLELGKKSLAVLCKTEEKGSKIKYYPYCMKSEYYLLQDKQGVLESSKVKILIAISKVQNNL